MNDDEVKRISRLPKHKLIAAARARVLRKIIESGSGLNEYREMLIAAATEYPDEILGPHWRLVSKIPVWPLCEAVAMSIDLDPLFADVLFASAGLIVFSGDAVGEAFARFIERHAEACGNIVPNGTLQVVDRAENPGACTVRLTEFAPWAASRGWSLPQKFPRTLNAGSTTAKSRRTRQDLMDFEIDAATAKLGNAATAAQVMRELQSFAGKPNSRIFEIGANFVLWKDSNGKVQKLFLDSLRKRLDRRAEKLSIER